MEESPAVPGKGHLIQRIFIAVSLVLMMTALFLIFVYVPTEENMGVVQRIFYLHVPLAWLAFLSYFVIFICSIAYLMKPQEKWDWIAYAAGEVGLLFTSLVLITGPIWAKPAWGTWWTWDARLTTTLILWVIYLAYLLIRSFANSESQGARFAAAIGIVGFLNVPLTALAVSLWRTQHPPAVIFEGGLESSMLLTLMVSLAAFTVLYVPLVAQRARLRRTEIELLKLEEELDLAGR